LHCITSLAAATSAWAIVEGHPAFSPGRGHTRRRQFVGFSNYKACSSSKRYRIATVSDNSEFAQNGFLLTYGSDPASLYLRGVEFVDKILRGDLPVEQPARFTLVINQKAAKLLDIAVPPSMLARADEVIE
jgi:putative ABC transport system substrate-binding protein